MGFTSLRAGRTDEARYVPDRVYLRRAFLFMDLTIYSLLSDILDLSNNEFSGIIPTETGLLTNLGTCLRCGSVVLLG